MAGNRTFRDPDAGYTGKMETQLQKGTASSTMDVPWKAFSVTDVFGCAGWACFKGSFFSGEFRGKKNVAVAAADGQEAGRKCTTLMTNHDVFQPFNTCVTARKTANALDSRNALIIFLGQPIWGVHGGGVTRGEEINSRAWTSYYFHALLFVWEPPFFLLFFYNQVFFLASLIYHTSLIQISVK